MNESHTSLLNLYAPIKPRFTMNKISKRPHFCNVRSYIIALKLALYTLSKKY